MKLQSEREICGDLILMLMVSLKCGLWSFKKNVLVVQKAKNKDYIQFGSSGLDQDKSRTNSDGSSSVGLNI